MGSQRHGDGLWAVGWDLIQRSRLVGSGRPRCARCSIRCDMWRRTVGDQNPKRRAWGTLEVARGSVGKPRGLSCCAGKKGN
ncbi:hypothetical protein V6N12_005423 [Hibiscus sabdariffa]|uniref:Uncharacterized protein n=1 Tax=Hibiscus sabdariffa TaxID=183260 RepID=A0ABR2ANS4_9ROSI